MMHLPGLDALGPWSLALVLLWIASLTLVIFQADSFREKKRLGILVTLSFVGAFFLACAKDLLTAVVAWELVALPLTFAAALPTNSARKTGVLLSTYFADFFSFVLLALGVVLLFAQFQTLSLPEMAEALEQESLKTDFLLYAGLALWFAGLLTRLGAVPFHLVLFDRAQAGSLSIAGVSLVVLPFSAAAFSWQFVGTSVHSVLPQWHDFLGGLGLITVWAGSLGMLVRSETRQFLGYSVIAQSGWVLLALVCMGPGSLEAVCFNFLFVQAIALLLLCFGFTVLEVCFGRESTVVFRGLLRTRPALGFILATGFAVLGSLPLTAGFSYRMGMLAKLSAWGMPSLAFLAALSLIPGLYACVLFISKLAALPAPPVQWIRPARTEVLFFWLLAALLWVAGFLPTIGWLG